MSTSTSTGPITRGGERERGSPKPPTTTQQRVEEVLRRKAEAEKRVAERREALKQEQANKLEKINAFREQERRERMRKNAEKELIRQKEALDRRQAQLEENQKKKEAILAKAHAATSRTANKDSNKKSFAFGSSTPRELAYLQTLSKEAKVYDKRLRPEPPSPTRVRPSATASTPSAMTSSVYVFSGNREARPAPRVMSRIRSTVTSSAPSNHPTGGNIMTQSMHVSSSSGFPQSLPRPPLPRAARTATGPTPTRAPRAASTHTATEQKKREPPARRGVAATASSTPTTPAGRAIRPRAVAAAGGKNAQPVAPSPLTVATNQEVSSSTSSLQVENTPPAPPSEDSDAGFSEGSYERAGSEKSTPVHGGVEQTIEEELTPREEHPAVDLAAELAVETAPEQVEEEKEEEEAPAPPVASPAPLVEPPTELPMAAAAAERVVDVVEMDYAPPIVDVVQTPVVEAQLVEEEKETVEQPTVPQEIPVEATVEPTVVHETSEELPTVPQEVAAPEVPQVTAEEPVVPEEKAPEVTVAAVEEERNLLVDFSEPTVEEKVEEEEKTPLVEEVTPIGGRSLADELGELMGGGKREETEVKKEEKVESLIQIDKVAPSSDVLIPSLLEDPVVNSLADELNQALGGVVEKKQEVERRESVVPPSASSPTPSHEEGAISAHPSTSSLPSGSSSGTESGESSPNTRRRRTEEKKAEMMKQSTILAMADSAAKERDERKARLAAIMNRTRGGAASGAAPSSMTTSMSGSLTGDSAASSVLAKIAHITSNPRIMQVAEKTGSSSDLRMGEMPGAVPY